MAWSSVRKRTPVHSAEPDCAVPELSEVEEQAAPQNCRKAARIRNPHRLTVQRTAESPRKWTPVHSAEPDCVVPELSEVEEQAAPQNCRKAARIPAPQRLTAQRAAESPRKWTPVYSAVPELSEVEEQAAPQNYRKAARIPATQRLAAQRAAESPRKYLPQPETASPASYGRLQSDCPTWPRPERHAKRCAPFPLLQRSPQSGFLPSLPCKDGPDRGRERLA